MDKHEEQIRRAEEAQAILSSAMFDKAFTDTRVAILNAIASLDNLRDDRARDLHSMVKGLEKVRRVIEEHIATGKLSAKEIEGRKRLFEFRKQA